MKFEKELAKARVEIENEMKSKGFIDDSDNCDRFLDNLSKKLLSENYPEDEIDDLLSEIKDKIMSNYKSLSEIQDDGHFGGVYYNTEETFENFDQFNNHFCLGE